MYSPDYLTPESTTMQMNAPGVCHTQKSTHFPTPARGDPRNKGGKNAAEKKTKTTNQRSAGVTLPETNSKRP